MVSRGSEWLLWDLHFHTPSSYDYKDKSVTNRDIIEGVKKSNISVLAITDHHEIDVPRYKELKKLGLEQGITVLPGIEFLSDARGSQPIHFIAIFSEEANVDYIWAQIKNRTSISKIEGEGKKHGEVYCDLVETIQIIKELGGIVTIHAGVKHGSVENITNSLEHAVAQKVDIAQLIDIYELGKASDYDSYKNIVFPALKKTMSSWEVDIPMIICSDNHNIKKYEIKERLWIKGSPGFQGLKYALNEPDERFFIGNEPPVLKRVRDNKTKYVDFLKIQLSGQKDSTNIWFEDVSIPLNSELVTIIGNKGNGKSAIADILALCLDGENSEDYHFLQKGKFLEKGLADRFSASASFLSGNKTSTKRLDSKIDSTNEKLLKYLPQSYFEKLCNEIGKVEAFRKEIEKVVFQYVPEHNKSKKNNFQELLSFKKEAIDKQLIAIKDLIRGKNIKIIEVEDMLDPNYLKNLNSKLKVKEDELEAHLKNEPQPVADPAIKNKEVQDTHVENPLLKDWELVKSQAEVEVESLKLKASEIGINLSELTAFKDETVLMVNEINRFKQEKKDILMRMGLSVDNVLKIEFDLKDIESMVSSLEVEKSVVLKSLVVADDLISTDIKNMNAVSRFKKAEIEIKQVVEKLSDEQKSYQNYLQELKDWKKKKDDIVGTLEISDSITFIKSKIEYVDKEALIDLSRMRKERTAITKDLYLKKSEVKNIYDDVKTEIDKVLDGSKVKNFKIVSGFYPSESMERKIMGEIRQNRVGTFYGAEDGLFIYRDTVTAGVDWNKIDDVIKFQDTLIHCLENDVRNINEIKKSHIASTVKDRESLYNYLYGLDFLEPHYNLQQNEKNLEQLSPGEKGALLLVFYLVLDKDDIPLVIDQPEDNLDNNSVAEILVPFIREAKKLRQIIMVTHNPNLAVVADSEQVIRVSVDKKNGYAFSFDSGGIEDKNINSSILEVLEGNAPAFKQRKNKYRDV